MSLSYRIAAGLAASTLLGLTASAQAGSFGGTGIIGYGSPLGAGSYRAFDLGAAAMRLDNHGATVPYSQERVDWLRQQVQLHMKNCSCALCQELRADPAG